MKKNVGNGFLKLKIILVLFLLSFLPFAFSGAFIRPAQTAKSFFLLYCVICFIIFIIYFFIKKSIFRICVTQIDFALTILLGYLVSNYLLQDIVSFSFRFYELLGLAVSYIIIRQTKKKYIPWFFLALTTGGLLQAVYGNLQLYEYFPSLHDDFKITGSFFNPGPFAGYLASVFPIALGVWFFHNTSQKKRPDFEQQANISFRKRFFIYTSFISGAAILLVLPASQSRAAILAVAASSVYLAFRGYNKHNFLLNFLNTPLKKVTVIFLTGVILSGSLIAGYWLKKDSADGRLLIWKVTGQMIKGEPFIGLGFDRFRAGYMDAQATYFQNSPDDPAASLAGDNQYAFNEFLQFTAEQGIVGLSLLLLLGILIIRTSSKTNSIWLIISKAGILSIVVFSSFSYPSQILPIKLNLILFLAIVASYGKPLNLHHFSIPGQLEPWIKSIALILVIGGSVLATYHLNDLRDAFKKWKLGLDLYNSGNIELAVRAYDEVYPVFDREGDFLMNYGKALSMAGEHQRAIQIINEAKKHLNNSVIQTTLGDSYKAREEYSEAEEAYLLASWMVPSRFYSKYLLVKLYEETNQWEKATLLAKELIDKEPKIESTAVEEIKEEMERILILHEDKHGEPVDFSPNDSEGFENLPFEINKRVVISEPCDKIIYSSNQHHAFNPSVLDGAFSKDRINYSALLQRTGSDFYPYSISEDCRYISLVSEDLRAGGYTIHLYDLEKSDLLSLPQKENSDNGFPLFSPDEPLLSYLSGGKLNLYDYESEENISIAKYPNAAFQNITWSPDGKTIYLQSQSDDIWSYNLEQGQFESIWRSPSSFYTDRLITPSVENEGVFYFLSDHESTVNQVYKFTPEDGIQIIIESPYDKYLVQHPVENGEIYYRENIDGYFSLKEYKNGKSTELNMDQGVVYGAYPFEDGFITTYAGLNEPASIFKVTDTSTTDLLNQSGQKAIPTPQKIFNKDGMAHLLYRPYSDNIKKWILWLHGGPHEQMSIRYNVYINSLVQEGFGVIALNYPGSTGIGNDYEMRDVPYANLVEHQIESIEEDLQKIRDSEPDVELDQLYIVGVSYGSVLAHTLTQSTQINVARLVDFSGLYSGFNNMVDIPKLYIYGAYDYTLRNPDRIELIKTETENHGQKKVIIDDEGHVIHRRNNIHKIIREINSFFDSPFI